MRWIPTTGRLPVFILLQLLDQWGYLRCPPLSFHPPEAQRPTTLFTDFSSAFNTIFPQQLILKLVLLGLFVFLNKLAARLWPEDHRQHRQQHLQLHHTEQSPPRTCAEPPTRHSADPWLYTYIHLHPAPISTENRLFFSPLKLNKNLLFSVRNKSSLVHTVDLSFAGRTMKVSGCCWSVIWTLFYCPLTHFRSSFPFLSYHQDNQLG